MTHATYVPVVLIHGFWVTPRSWENHRAVGFTHEQWHYAFTNTSAKWGSALANIHPGRDDTYVNYRNDDRAPLLFVAGSEDHLREGREAIERELARAPEDVRGSFRWLPLGATVELA